eukprot:symbB.v1.2.023819.t1/scaffold2190.1/size86289/3
MHKVCSEKREAGPSVLVATYESSDVALWDLRQPSTPLSYLEGDASCPAICSAVLWRKVWVSCAGGQLKMLRLKEGLTENGWRFFSCGSSVPRNVHWWRYDFESLALPALSILGSEARRLLILGGVIGGGVANVFLQSSDVEEVVLGSPKIGYTDFIANNPRKVMSAATNGLVFRRLLFVAPAVGATAQALKARYWTPEQHSGFLAMWSLGPGQCLRTIPWRLEILVKLWPVHRHIQTLTTSHDLRQHGFQPHVDDVIVAVPPKSGTTMLLQACHQLRMKGRWGGEVDFEDQMDVIPMLEGGPASLLPNCINEPQMATPRLYKSHLRCKTLDDLPVKRVYSFRDLKDVLVSDWKFTASMLDSEIPLEMFALMRIVPGGIDRALVDLCEWWEHRNDKAVCFFFFDDVLEDRIESVERLEEFMGLEHDPKLVKIVAEQCSHAFMCKHHSKFDDHKILAALDARCSFRRTNGDQLVGKVRVDGGRSGAIKASQQCVPSLSLADQRLHVLHLTSQEFLQLPDAGHFDIVVQDTLSLHNDERNPHFWRQPEENYFAPSRLEALKKLLKTPRSLLVLTAGYLTTPRDSVISGMKRLAGFVISQ